MRIKKIAFWCIRSSLATCKNFCFTQDLKINGKILKEFKKHFPLLLFKENYGLINNKESIG